MRQKKFFPALVLTLVLLCGITIGASAANGLQEIKAYLNANITVKLNGEAQTLLDANGTRVYPITYNGSTYLPVRAVAGLVGLSVDWDQATQTVLLGKQPGGVDLIDTYKIYYSSGKVGQSQSADGKTEDISGISCNHWLWFVSSHMGYGNVAVASYNLQGKHDSLTFSYYADRDTTLTVLGDNDAVLGEYAITGGAVAQTVTIPLFKTNELKFQVALLGSASASIFNAYLDAE